jgi:CBS domain-containing protein
MSGWIMAAMPKALLDAAICFDFRALHGDETLPQSLREWIGGRVSAHPAFLRHLAQAAVQARPALGRFGGLATQDSLIDLKLNGARIFVDAARVYALAMNVPQTNTADRLRTARERLGMAENDVAALVQAFYYIQSLRLRTQASGKGQANAVDARQLNRLEAGMLKESLKLARELQSRLALDYQL